MADRPRELGDRARFEQLYRTHCAEILRFAAARSDAEIAQEVLAETFLVAWRRLADVPVDHERAWLFAVARFVLANEHRSERRRGDLAVALAARTPASLRSSPDHADSLADRDAIRAVLDRLPPGDREALQLTDWDGLSPAEAARVVGCSAATFRVRLHRARRRLIAIYDAQNSRPESPSLRASQLNVGDEAT